MDGPGLLQAPEIGICIKSRTILLSYAFVASWTISILVQGLDRKDGYATENNLSDLV